MTTPAAKSATPATPAADEPKTVRLHKNAVGQVSAATPANVETEDGFLHVFRRWYPKLVLDSNTPQGYAAAVKKFMEDAVAISNGAKVEIVDDEGNVITTLVPTDAVPSKNTRTERDLKNDKGEVVGKEVTIDHGANMALSLPLDYTEIATAINTGIQNVVGRDSRSAVVAEYRKGGGKTGRASSVPNFAEAS